MTEQPKNYCISGKTYTEEDLKIYAKGKVKNPSTPDWEKDIHRFILDWISPIELLEVHTSGSTGVPRYVEIPKSYFVASATASIESLNLKKGGIAFLCLPTEYIAGKMMIVRALVGGLDLHYTEPSSIPDMSGLQNIEFAGMIPMQVVKLLETETGKKQLEKIKKLIIGGSFVPVTLEEKVKSLPNQIWSTYGMTETITHIALRRLNGPEVTDQYTPMPTVKLRLDERGCAIVDAEYIGIKGLITNDLAQISPDGRFRILGRIDNVVMSGGLLLHPEIIEKKLHGFINTEFFLAGLRDHELGERLVLFIEDPKKEMVNKEDEIWKIINERLTGYDVPRSIVFMEEFSRTGNAKILRPNTVEDYVAQFDESTEEV
jgi:o-succinylbenzoate---CoA ligase